MKPGDLVSIVSVNHDSVAGVGVYLGHGRRGDSEKKSYKSFLWRGRVATFDPPHWIFEVINESR